MCGIAGILNLDGAPFTESAVLERMTAAMAHRGPDDAGIYVNGPIGLGHRRLSILDLSAAGHQPMRDPQRGLATVYNGEIYNFADIRQNVGARERPFLTNCDTEVILRTADFDSTRWVDRFNGMFAIALWDERARRLMLVRDRFGVKPLYWAIVRSQFVFASEIRSLLRHPAVPCSVRESAIPEFLAFRTVTGRETLLDGIFECKPGHRILVEVGDRSPTELEWWNDARAPAWPATGASAAECFHELFDSAVRYRLVSDVPVGTYNSGGVDSTLVTAAVRRMTSGSLHTFSVGFQEPTFDESQYAKLVAQRLGTEHHTVVLDGEAYGRHFLDATYYLEFPINHAHTVPLLVLSRLAKQYVTVVLTGEGADEVFAGYPRHQLPMLAAGMRHIPRPLIRAGAACTSVLGLRRLAKLLAVSEEFDTSIVNGARWVQRNVLKDLGLPGGPPVERMAILQAMKATNLTRLETVLAFDRASYLPPLLHRLDRTTMASGVEARVPFLDYRLVNWSKSLPQSMKLSLGRQLKVLLKAETAKLFPRDMVYRRKMGFDVPVAQWLRQESVLGRYLDVLTDETARQRGFVRANAVGRFVTEHRAGHADHSDILWPLLTLEVWLRMFVDRRGERLVA